MLLLPNLGENIIYRVYTEVGKWSQQQTNESKK